MANSNRDKKLEGFIQAIEAEDAEIKTRNEAKSEIYKAAKEDKYNVKVMRKLIAERRMDPEKRREEFDLLSEYRAALGMDD